MLELHSAKVDVKGTKYTVAYKITKNEGEVTAEYGILCSLYDSNGTFLEKEEIKCVTPTYETICWIFSLFVKNQVFPVHLKEIVSDLLEVRMTVKK